MNAPNVRANLNKVRYLVNDGRLPEAYDLLRATSGLRPMHLTMYLGDAQIIALRDYARGLNRDRKTVNASGSGPSK